MNCLIPPVNLNGMVPLEQNSGGNNDIITRALIITHPKEKRWGRTGNNQLELVHAIEAMREGCSEAVNPFQFMLIS